jgi:hypothetical protein
MRRRSTTFLLALVALASVAVLAGCGVERTVDPIAAAATKTQNAGGAKVAMTVGVTADGTSFDVKANGLFDQSEGDLTMDLSDALAAAGQPGSGKVELRYRQESGDTVLYLNMPALTSRLPGSPSWVRLDLQQAGSALGVDLNQLLTQGGQSPSDVLDLLRASGSVTEVGTETVNGDSTTHYKASIELAKATDDLGASARAMVQRLIDAGAPAAIPVDVWVGDDGLVRKLTLDESVSMQGHTGDVKLDLELSDYGTSVVVAAPPPDETLDLSGLLSQFGAGAGSTH